MSDDYGKFSQVTEDVVNCKKQLEIEEERNMKRFEDDIRNGKDTGHYSAARCLLLRQCYAKREAQMRAKQKKESKVSRPKSKNGGPSTKPGQHIVAKWGTKLPKYNLPKKESVKMLFKKSKNSVSKAAKRNNKKRKDLLNPIQESEARSQKSFVPNKTLRVKNPKIVVGKRKNMTAIKKKGN